MLIHYQYKVDSTSTRKNCTFMRKRTERVSGKQGLIETDNYRKTKSTPIPLRALG